MATPSPPWSANRPAATCPSRTRRLYQALHRLHRQDLVDAEWGPSENNRRARFYTLTPAGRKRLREETANWRRYVRAVDAVLQGA